MVDIQVLHVQAKHIVNPTHVRRTPPDLFDLILRNPGVGLFGAMDTRQGNRFLYRGAHWRSPRGAG